MFIKDQIFLRKVERIINLENIIQGSSKLSIIKWNFNTSQDLHTL